MRYKEVLGNLFDYKSEYYLVHCISSDFALGKGIAVEFNRQYNMKNKLYQNYTVNGLWPNCLLVDNVFNLVTKEKYWHKPTYETLLKALYKLREQCVLYGIKKLAMPMIGCGLDGLNWEKTSDMIRNVFETMDIEILVVKRD